MAGFYLENKNYKINLKKMKILEKMLLLMINHVSVENFLDDFLLLWEKTWIICKNVELNVLA